MSAARRAKRARDKQAVRETQEGLRLAVERGYVVRVGDQYKITDAGREHHDRLAKLPGFGR